MSAVALATGADRPIGWVPTLRAELTRTRWSAAAFLPASGLVLALLSTSFAGLARLNGSIGALLSWQALYATGLAAPLMSLLAALVVRREQLARSGGTPWRDVSPARVAVCRGLVIAGLALIFHLLCFGGITLVVLAFNVPGSLGTVVTAGVVSWLSALSLLAVAFAAAERVSMVPVFLLATGWQLLGTLTAERTWWWALPPAWAVRANLPALGIHANAVFLEPGEALAAESPWPALLLGLLLAVAATAVAAAARHPRRRRAAGLTRRDQRPRRLPLGGFHRGRYPAIALGLSGTAVLPLTLAAVLVCSLTAIVYDHTYVSGLYTYLVLPLGSTLLAVLAWSAQQQAWWTLVLRDTRTWRTLAVWIMVHVAATSCAVAVITAVSGGGSDVLRQLAMWVLTGSVLGLLALLLVIRWGPGTALGVAVVWTVLAVTVGGDVLAGTFLWIFALPAWAEAADSAERVLIATAVCLVGVAVLLPLIRRALRRHCALPPPA